MFKKNYLKVLGVLALLTLFAGGYFYINLFKTNVPAHLEEKYIKIPTGSNFEDLVNQLNQEGFILDEDNFRWWANRLEFTKVRSGRFEITPGISSYQLVKYLQRGEQAAVRLVLSNERFDTDIAAKAARTIEADSLSLITLLRDTAYLDSIGYDFENLLTIFIPNTYEFFWNTTPRGLVQRMIKEHDKFWTDERKDKATALGLTPEEVYTLASIVEWETNKKDEKPIIAGVYLNRLNSNEPLGADPTVQYALMQSDGGPMRRLYNRDYRFPHAYNTYIHTGLPPGPIGMATIVTIDAVLNAEKHNYMFFCSKPDDSGYHVFAESYEAHLVNARLYSEYLERLTRNRSL